MGAIVAAALISHSAHAANGTWLGSNGTTGNWTATNNWVGGIVAGSVNTPTDNSTATFNNNTNTTVSLTDSSRLLRQHRNRRTLQQPDNQRWRKCHSRHAADQQYGLGDIDRYGSEWRINRWCGNDRGKPHS